MIRSPQRSSARALRAMISFVSILSLVVACQGASTIAQGIQAFLAQAQVSGEQKIALDP